MEDGLWPRENHGWALEVRVLILVLVEDGLWYYGNPLDHADILSVLILVLVEDGLW